MTDTSVSMQQKGVLVHYLREDDSGDVAAVLSPNVVPKIKTMPYAPTTVAQPARADRYQSDPNLQTPARGLVIDEVHTPDRRTSWHGILRKSVDSAEGLTRV